MRILALETSTEWCSVAIGDGGRWLRRDERAGQRHSERVLPMVKATLAEAGWALCDLDGIAFGAGPGSFTGIRVACGVAQGLAFGADLPVVPVTTLEALAQEVYRVHRWDRVLCCLDARMREIYVAAYARGAGAWREVAAPAVMSPDRLLCPDEAGAVWAGAGTGFEAYADLAPRLALGRTDSAARPSAQSVGELALPRFEAGTGVAAAAALPVYVRHRVALTTAERDAGVRL